MKNLLMYFLTFYLCLSLSSFGQVGNFINNFINNDNRVPARYKQQYKYPQSEYKQKLDSRSGMAKRIELTKTMLSRNLGNRFIPTPHRGLHGKRWLNYDEHNLATYYPYNNPENSLISIKSADAFYSMIELDVRIDKYKEPYLLHDATLGRTVDLPHNISTFYQFFYPFVPDSYNFNVDRGCTTLKDNGFLHRNAKCAEWNPSRNSGYPSGITLKKGRFKNIDANLHLKNDFHQSMWVYDYKLPLLVDVMHSMQNKNALLILLDIQDLPTFKAVFVAIQKFRKKNAKAITSGDIPDPADYFVLKTFCSSISLKNSYYGDPYNRTAGEILPLKKPLFMPVIQSRDYKNNSFKKTVKGKRINMSASEVIDWFNRVHTSERLHTTTNAKKLNILGIQLSWWGTTLYVKQKKTGKFVKSSISSQLINKIKKYKIPLAAFQAVPDFLDDSFTPIGGGNNLHNAVKNGFYTTSKDGKMVSALTKYKKPTVKANYIEVAPGTGLYALNRFTYNLSSFINHGFNMVISDAPGQIFAPKNSWPELPGKHIKIPEVLGYTRIKKPSTSDNEVEEEIDMSFVNGNIEELEESVPEDEKTNQFDYLQDPAENPCKLKQTSWRASKVISVNFDEKFMLNTSGLIQRFDEETNTWQTLSPNKYLDFGVSSDNTWAISTSNQLHVINYDGKLVDTGLKMKKIAVNTLGDIYCIGKDNRVYSIEYSFGDEDETKIKSPTFKAVDMGGMATEIAVDANGDAWHIGSNQTIWRWHGEENRWILMPGTGKSLATGQEDQVYLVGTDSMIYCWYESNQNWTKLSELGSNWQQVNVIDEKQLIGIDIFGKVFESECDVNHGNYVKPSGFTCVKMFTDKKVIKSATNGEIAVFITTDGKLLQFDNKTWKELATNVLDVAIDAQGLIWYVGKNNFIYKQDAESLNWVTISGNAKKIAIGGSDDEQIAFIGMNNRLLMLDQYDQKLVETGQASVSEITVDSYGKVWYIGLDNFVYKQIDAGWEMASGAKAKKISASQETVSIIGMDGSIYAYEGGLINKWWIIPTKNFAGSLPLNITVSDNETIIGIGTNNLIYVLNDDCSKPMLENYVGSYLIQNVQTGMMLESPAGADANFQQKKMASITTNQTFDISILGGGVTLNPRGKTNSFMSVLANNANNASVKMASNNSRAVRFNILPLGYEDDGTLICEIQSMESELSLGVKDNRDPRIVQWDVYWDALNDKRFQWRLIPTNSNRANALQNQNLRIESDTLSEPSVVISPNPTSDNFEVEIKDFDENEDLIVSISDLMGNTIFNKNVRKVRTLSLSIHDLKLVEKSYLISVSNQTNKRVTKTLIIGGH